MGYVNAGMGEVSSSNYNTTRYPGIAKPTNLSTLETFMELQRQMNRYAQGRGAGAQKIAVDGDIGPSTQKLWRLLWSMVGPSPLTSYDYKQIAAVSDTAGPQLRSMADALNVPGTVTSPKPSKPPSIYQPSTGTEVTAPPSSGAGGGIMASITSMSPNLQMAAGVGVAAVLFLALRKKKGRK